MNQAMNELGIWFAGIFCVLVTTIYYLLNTAKPVLPPGVPEGYRQLGPTEWVRNGDIWVEESYDPVLIHDEEWFQYPVSSYYPWTFYRKIT